jgi:hypothetical protein
VGDQLATIDEEAFSERVISSAADIGACKSSPILHLLPTLLLSFSFSLLTPFPFTHTASPPLFLLSSQSSPLPPSGSFSGRSSRVKTWGSNSPNKIQGGSQPSSPASGERTSMHRRPGGPSLAAPENHQTLINHQTLVAGTAALSVAVAAAAAAAELARAAPGASSRYSLDARLQAAAADGCRHAGSGGGAAGMLDADSVRIGSFSAGDLSEGDGDDDEDDDEDLLGMMLPLPPNTPRE